MGTTMIPRRMQDENDALILGLILADRVALRRELTAIMDACEGGSVVEPRIAELFAH